MTTINSIKLILDEYDKPCTCRDLYQTLFTDEFKNDIMNKYKPKNKTLNFKLLKIDEANNALPDKKVEKEKKAKGRPRKIKPEQVNII
jgi:hypothetical protein